MEENVFHKFEVAKRVILVTGTLYTMVTQSERVRAELAKRTIKDAHENGFEIIVLDSGSPKELLSEFANFGAIVKNSQYQGMGPGRREAIFSAYEKEKEVIVWIEPEKYTIIPELVKIVEPILYDSADFVIPRRISLASYPKAQQYTEPFGNAYFRELTGWDLDVFFGPRVFKSAMAKYFCSYDGKYWDKWDAIFVPLLDAIHEGRRLLSVNVDYTHPREQTEIEEHDLRFYRKRLFQLENIMKSMGDHWLELEKKG